MGSRTAWVVALLVAVLTLPIVAITVYFQVGIDQQIARAQTERQGLDGVDRFERLTADISALAMAASCPKVARTTVAAARARADADVDALNDSDVRGTWQSLRSSELSQADFDSFFDGMRTWIINLGDRSGLTFDPAIPGIDLGDSLGYRIPPAIDRLQRVRRSLCAGGSSMGMSQRITLVEHQTRAQQALTDNAQDVADVLTRAESRQSVAALSAASYRAQAAATVASTRLDALMTGPASAPGRAMTVEALDALIGSLYDLWRNETPVFRAMIDRRLEDLGRQRMIALVPGVVGVLAALLVSFLTIRLIYERAALTIAEKTAAENAEVAMHDPLTGLLNRRAFVGVMQRALAGPHDGAVCLLDIDNFKHVNDTYGHLSGDDVLINVSRIIEASVRSTDAVARLGGDEFAIFLHSPIDLHGVERVLASIAAEAAAPILSRGQTIRSTISAGASMIGLTTDGVEDALAAADLALYAAKSSARGSFIVQTAAAGA
ncbi:MAG: GGDEF domain-containing protein [Candidatus Eremiobacteraeota bacterium]|nr:GGDEF domain-containing protein [Candidatus Eremiobacteraeota bacterium]